MNLFKKEYDFDSLREEMVAQQLAGRDITDERVLEAFRRVERHAFIDSTHWDEAYEDHPVHIGCGQTISQPYIVAYMTQALELTPGMRVLEIGTGSGYQTAILAALGSKVYTIERHEDLTERASVILEELELDEDVEYFVGDGTVGIPEEAPYDRIIVTAAAPNLPQQLKDQLSSAGGRMVIPVGTHQQDLIVCTRKGEEFTEESVMAVIFVPLIGEEGF